MENKAASSEIVFIGKCSLALLVAGIVLFGLGIMLGTTYEGIAIGVLIFCLLVSFAMATYARETKIGQVTMKIAGLLLIIGFINYLLFALMKVSI